MRRKFIDLLIYRGGYFASSPLYIKNDMEDFIGKYNGNQIDSRLDKVKDMVGATASGAGAAGFNSISFIRNIIDVWGWGLDIS